MTGIEIQLAIVCFLLGAILAVLIGTRRLIMDIYDWYGARGGTYIYCMCGSCRKRYRRAKSFRRHFHRAHLTRDVLAPPRGAYTLYLMP